MSMQNIHINNEVIRQEQERQRMGLSGGAMQLRSYKDDSAKRVLAIARKGVAQFEADEKLSDIKDSVDRFKVDRYFNDLSTSIADVINNYLQGVKQNDTGDIISKYNELCMYIKTVIKWKTLSENDRNMITAKFNELLPQVDELMDVAITEKYTDAKQIQELKNNLVVRNYVPIMYVNYAEAIKGKKPDYSTRKILSTKLFRLLNEPGISDATKEDLEDRIEAYDDARNKFVSAKNKERKLYYKGIIDNQEKVLNRLIDTIFGTVDKISRVDLPEHREIDEEWEPADTPWVLPTDRYVEKPERRKRPIKRSKEEMQRFIDERPQLAEFVERKKDEQRTLDAIEQDREELDDNIASEIRILESKLFAAKDEYDALLQNNTDILQAIDGYRANRNMYKRVLGRKNLEPATRESYQKLMADGEALPRKLKENGVNITRKQKQIKAYELKIIKLRKDKQTRIHQLEAEKQGILYLRNPADVEARVLRDRTVKELKDKASKRIEEEQLREYYDLFPEEAQQERDQLAMLREDRMHGHGKRRGPKKGRGVPKVLRNAIRKPLGIKNPSENDPSINLFPTYDLSKYDLNIKRK